MASSIAITPNLLVRAFQISDFLKAAKLPYPTEEAKSIITGIVNERLRPPVSKEPTTRTTQRALSAEPTSYPADWAVDRSKFVTDTRAFVVEYNNWYGESRARSGTVTPPRKDYSTGATPVHTPNAPEREKPTRASFDFEGAINKLVLPSIERDRPATAPVGAISSTGETTEPSNPSHSTGPTTPGPTMPEQNFQNSGFTEQQLATLRALIGESRATPGERGERGERGEPGPPDGNGGSERWNAQEIGFFDPHYDGKTAATASAVEHAGKDTYFRDVHVFIEKIKDMATIKEAEMVRNNLYTCLRGTALE